MTTVTWTEHMAAKEPWTFDDLMTLPWEQVQSSQVMAVAWVTQDGSTQLALNPDPQTEEQAHLFVQFRVPRDKPPSVYVYRGVDKDAYETLLGAESIGRQLNASIKAPGLPYFKLPVDTEAPLDDGGD